MDEDDNLSSWLNPVYDGTRGKQHYSSSTITRKRGPSPSPVTEAPPDKRYNLFHHTSEKEKFQWALPQELADYYNDSSRRYIPPKEIDESITHDLPVPSNIDKVPVMDSFISSIISSMAGKSKITNRDDDLKGIFNKIRNVMGPLGTVWKDIEQYRSGECEEVDPDVIANLVQKSIILLGQACNAVSLQRRVGILGNFMEPTAATSLIKNKGDVLKNDPEHLFGKEFQDYLKDQSKMSQNVQDYFKGLAKKKNFYRAPSQGKTEERGKTHRQMPVGTTCLVETTNQRTTKTENRILANRDFQVKLVQDPCFDILQGPGWLQGLNHVHPLVRKMFRNILPKGPFAGRIKLFLPNWQKITNDQVKTW